MAVTQISNATMAFHKYAIGDKFKLSGTRDSAWIQSEPGVIRCTRPPFPQ
jgi:hypothetical protein